jgi:hypothetical protein
MEGPTLRRSKRVVSAREPVGVTIGAWMHFGWGRFFGQCGSGAVGGK